MVLDEVSNQQGVSILFDFNPTESDFYSVAAEIFLTPSQVSAPLSCEFCLRFLLTVVLGLLEASLDIVISGSDKLSNKVMTRNEVKPHHSSF